MAAFRLLHGHLNVSQNFSVPEAEPWPPVCWRMPFCSRVAAVRSQGQHATHATLVCRSLFIAPTSLEKCARHVRKSIFVAKQPPTPTECILAP